jgi:hypothetical protein
MTEKKRIMTSATIKLFLPHGDAKSLRTAEISNWSGKAIAAPRTEIEELFAREELDKPGVYILLGSDPNTNVARAYVGEAEVLRDRFKQHKSKEFWVAAIAFVSKDENLTKAHVRYLESRILVEALSVGRYVIEQNQAGGSKLPESDREDMEVFLSRIRQLLPVLGSDILTPVAQVPTSQSAANLLFCTVKTVEARGRRSPNGFVIYKGSSAVSEMRPSAQQWVITLRQQLLDEGTLTPDGELLRFMKDVEFASPSAAAATVRGGNSNGLTAWKTKDDVLLKELDEQA